MNKKILILIIFLVSKMSLIAQNIIKLSNSHCLDQSGIDDGKPLTIQRYANYNLYLSLDSDSVSNLKNEEKEHFYDLALIKEEVKLKKGNYFIDSDDFYFKFYINENGFLNGNAFLKYPKRNIETEILFSKGVLVSSITKQLGQVYCKSELKDSIFITENYDKEGSIVSKGAYNLKLGGGQKNYISTHYFKNGKISSEQNNINQTFVAYYENGNLERESDDIKKFSRFYSENGKLESNSYTIQDEDCREIYDNGLISTKECKNSEGRKYYHYKSGILQFYEVYNNSNRKTTVFNAKGKLINKESISNQAPSIGF